MTSPVKMNMLLLRGKRGQIGGEMLDIFGNPAAGVVGEANVKTEAHKGIIQVAGSALFPIKSIV